MLEHPPGRLGDSLYSVFYVFIVRMRSQTPLLSFFLYYLVLKKLQVVLFSPTQYTYIYVMLNPVKNIEIVIKGTIFSHEEEHTTVASIIWFCLFVFFFQPSLTPYRAHAHQRY